MVIWAWIGALLIGLSLGLLGSGGSILTVPVLVYLVGEPEKLAIAESMGIVAVISLAGSLPYAFKRQVDWRNVLFFGLPGMAGTYLGAFISQYMTGAAQLVLFAVVMFVAAAFMFRPSPEVAGAPHTPRAIWKIVSEGLMVGLITGLVGVGGGFLIIPALVLLGGLSMQLAVGTSLLIIAIKSMTGLIKYVDILDRTGVTIHWRLVALFSVVGIVGSLAGSRMSGKFSHRTLKKGFAVFLVLMSAFILFENAGKLI